MADDSPAPKTYWVTAPTNVLGHKPSSSFSAVLDPVQEERLLDGGAISFTQPVVPNEESEAAPVVPESAKVPDEVEEPQDPKPGTLKSRSPLLPQ